MDDDPEPPSDDTDVHAADHVRLSHLADCTDVVLSAGHWHLSFFMQRKQGGPFTNHQLYELFTRARSFADALRAEGKRVYWATIMAHPIRHARFRHPYKYGVDAGVDVWALLLVLTHVLPLEQPQKPQWPAVCFISFHALCTSSQHACHTCF